MVSSLRSPGAAALGIGSKPRISKFWQRPSASVNDKIDRSHQLLRCSVMKKQKLTKENKKQRVQEILKELDDLDLNNSQISSLLSGLQDILSRRVTKILTT